MSSDDQLWEPIQVQRGGIRFPESYPADSDDAPEPWIAAGPWPPGGVVEAPLGPLVASGGFCAPASSFYDLVDRTPWTHADLPLWWRGDVDAWLFPRSTWARRSLAEARRRLRLAVAALRGPQDVEVDDDDDGWEGW